jgi:hypothetical protein
MIFIPHRKHVYGRPRPFTGIASVPRTVFTLHLVRCELCTATLDAEIAGLSLFRLLLLVVRIFRQQ